MHEHVSWVCVCVGGWRVSHFVLLKQFWRSVMEDSSSPQNKYSPQHLRGPTGNGRVRAQSLSLVSLLGSPCTLLRCCIARWYATCTDLRMLDFLPSSIFSLSSSWSTPSGTSLDRGSHCLEMQRHTSTYVKLTVKRTVKHPHFSQSSLDSYTLCELYKFSVTITSPVTLWGGEVVSIYIHVLYGD